MTKIVSSASKIVFILLAASLVLLTFVGKVEPKDFVMLTGMAFTYYFSKPATPSTTSTP
jgi:hypothetical protein